MRESRSGGNGAHPYGRPTNVALLYSRNRRQRAGSRRGASDAECDPRENGRAGTAKQRDGIMVNVGGVVWLSKAPGR